MLATTGRNARICDFRLDDYTAVCPGIPSDRIARSFLEDGPAFTAWWGDEILVCAGLGFFPWPHVASAWAIVSPAGRRRPVTVHRAVARMLDRLIALHGLHRVEAHVLEDHAAGVQWLARLGFVQEARCRAWGPRGEHALLFVRLTP